MANLLASLGTVVLMGVVGGPELGLLESRSTAQRMGERGFGRPTPDYRVMHGFDSESTTKR
jgi:hypothetical protein